MSDRASAGGVKVIIAPTITSVISDADLRTHLKLASDGSEDELMAAYRLAAHAAAEHYTGYAIGSQTLELALDEFPAGPIELPRGKVTAITSLKYIDENEDEQTIDSSSYTLDDYSPTCWLLPDADYEWPTALDAANVVKVRYVVGDVPGAAKAALLLMVGFMHKNRGDAPASDDIQPPAARALLDTIKVYAR